jgi:holliday junction resolvase YEN1
MGIHGLWEELAPAASRICPCPLPFKKTDIPALAKLAAQSWTDHRRPLHVAVDTAIWCFQIQNGQKGSNPALRTFYYRLCRLLKLNIRAIFVFDGPHKPPLKRNQPTAVHCPGYWEITQMKRLISAFGFMSWDAPGEAEAECSLLQLNGIVDLVVTEDVDSFVFGATKVAREIPENNRSHVNLYADVTEKLGLDKDGFLLIAMASGGDYLPAGIPSCGPKTAVEVFAPPKTHVH